MSHTSFLGIKVEGDIQHAGKRVQQKPLDELAPLMQALLDDLTIEWFGWIQYTPYFNDGDPCEFSIQGELGVKITPHPLEEASYDDHGALIEVPKYGYDEDDEEPDFWEGCQYNKALGTRENQWDEKLRKYVQLPYAGPDEARYDRCLALEKAIGSGAFDNVLLEHFGDHAKVRISRTGIYVEEYSHD